MITEETCLEEAADSVMDAIEPTPFDKLNVTSILRLRLWPLDTAEGVEDWKDAIANHGKIPWKRLEKLMWKGVLGIFGIGLQLDRDGQSSQRAYKRLFTLEGDGRKAENRKLLKEGKTKAGNGTKIAWKCWDKLSLQAKKDSAVLGAIFGLKVEAHQIKERERHRDDRAAGLCPDGCRKCSDADMEMLLKAAKRAAAGDQPGPADVKPKAKRKSDRSAPTAERKKRRVKRTGTEEV